MNKQKDVDIDKILKDIIEVSLLTGQLFDNDIAKATKWLNTNTELCFGDTVIEACLYGKGNTVMKWLRGRMGGYSFIIQDANNLTFQQILKEAMEVAKNKLGQGEKIDIALTSKAEDSGKIMYEFIANIKKK